MKEELNGKQQKQLAKLAEAMQSGAVQHEELEQVIKELILLISGVKETLSSELESSGTELVGKIAETKAQLGEMEGKLESLIEMNQSLSGEMADQIKEELLGEVAGFKTQIPTLPDLSEYEIAIAELDRKISAIVTNVTDTPQEVRDKLETLQGDERLDISAVKGLDLNNTNLSDAIINRAISIVDQRSSYLINKVSALQTQVNNINTSGGSGASIGGTVTGGTTGSVLFIGAASVLAQDNINFFFDDTNNSLRLQGGANFAFGTTTAVPIDAAANSNTFAQINIQNKSAGTTASSDIVATADNGTDSTNFVNFGIQSSGNTDATFTVVGAAGSYFYGTGDVAFGTMGSNTVYFFSGGTLSANRRGNISSAGVFNWGSSSQLNISATGGITTTGTYNKVTITQPASSAVLTIADGLTFSMSGASVTIVGSGTNTFTFPTSSDTIVGTAATQTLTNKTLTSAIVTTGITTSVANIITDTTTGTQIATATAQKIAFHGSTPVIQRVGAAQAAVVTTASTQTVPFGYATAGQADAIVTLVNELRAAMVEKGLIKGSA